MPWKVQNKRKDSSSAEKTATASFEEWLSSLNLECYSEKFKEAHLDFTTILHVSDDHLQELGVTAVGHRIKLRVAIEELSKGVKPTCSNQSTSSNGLGDSNAEKRKKALNEVNRSKSPPSNTPNQKVPRSPKSGNASPQKVSPNSTLSELQLIKNASDPGELAFKVIVVGDPGKEFNVIIHQKGTGKSTLIHRYQTGTWNPSYKATIGSDFSVKEFVWNNSTNLVVHFWDIGGQERFTHLTRVFYKQSQGAIVVFDVTNPRSFEGVAKWKADIDAKVTLADGTPLPVVLFANKVDLLTDARQLADLSLKLVSYCKENNFKGPYFTSAKSGYGIDNGFYSLVEAMLPKDLCFVPKYPNAGLLVSVKKKDSFSLMESPTVQRKKQDSCSC